MCGWVGHTDWGSDNRVVDSSPVDSFLHKFWHAEASFGLNVGELSKVISTDSGVHFILRVA